VNKKFSENALTSVGNNCREGGRGLFFSSRYKYNKIEKRSSNLFLSTQFVQNQTRIDNLEKLIELKIFDQQRFMNQNQI
jgi:hypothetical protein